MTEARDIIFVRHGETAWNVERRLQGHGDSALTARGRAQAADLGAALRSRGLMDGRAVRISPSGRCRRTADLMRVRGSIDDRLREIGLGSWEGRLHDDLARAHPELFLDETGHPFDRLWAAPGGEGRDAFTDRLCRVLDDIDGPALLVTHGIASLVMRGLALGLPYDDWPDQPRGQGVAFRLLGGTVTRIAP